MTFDTRFKKSLTVHAQSRFIVLQRGSVIAELDDRVEMVVQSPLFGGRGGGGGGGEGV